ncbi:MAG: DJ-1/PfpI family protein [Flavobacteriales bacterium]
MRSVYILLSFVTFLFVACQSPSEPATKPSDEVASIELPTNRFNVGFLVMDGVYNTELTAGYDIFHHTIFRDSIKPMNVFTVAQSLDPITSFEGMRILPDFSFRDGCPNIDILVVPSAEHHLDSDLENKEMLRFVKETANDATWVMSHCDGAFVLAKAGLLEGVESTTFPGDIGMYREMFPDLTVHEDVLFVHDGKFITSAGGAKTFEASLYLAEVMYGKEIADDLAKGLVIDWDLEAIAKVIVEE